MEYSHGIKKAAQENEARRVIRSDSVGDPESPAFVCEAYASALPDVEFMRSVFGGTKTMRAQKKTFLPQHPVESTDKYEARVAVAVALNALKTTVEGLIGMIFRRDPTLSEEVPEQLQEMAKNVDLRGNSLAVFAHSLADDALLDGHAWLLVDAPRGAGVRTQKQAEAVGIQPYWIKIPMATAHNWQWEIRDGRPYITLFAYHEPHKERAGTYGQQTQQRIRVLRETVVAETEEGEESVGVIGELWQLEEREIDDPQGGKKRIKEWVRLEVYDLPVSRVPVVFVPSNEVSEYESCPPLQDLGYEQVEFYRVRSERQKSLTFSSISVPYVFGQQVCDENGVSKVRWGADGMLLLNDPSASAGVLESSGNGLAAQKEELAAIKENMATLGLRMIQKEPGTQPNTATAEILGKSESNANLATFATSLEVALTDALKLSAEYRSDLDPENVGAVKVNRDFHENLLTSADIKAIGDEVARGNLSLDTMWDMMIEGEWLDEEFDREAERARIEEESAARMAEMADLFGTPTAPGEDPPAPGQKPPARPPVEA